MKLVTLLTFLCCLYYSRSSLFGPEVCSQDSLCKDKHPGTFVYHPKRFYFYTCVKVNHKLVNIGCQRCGDINLVYNEYCKACISKFDDKLNKCPKPTATGGQDFCAPAHFCEGKPSNVYYSSPYNNQKFFSCIGGKATQCQSCQNDLVFSEKCQQCLFPYQTQCETSPGGKPAGSETCDPWFCDDRSNGNYEENPQHPSGRYRVCTEGTCIVRKCAPINTVFSKACNRCTHNYIRNPSDCKNDQPPKH